jgi:hypothetical protein
MPAPLARGLLLGDTASPGVTEIAGMEPLRALDPETVEGAIGQVECEVVGFFRAERGNSLQPGASLRMTQDDLALAAGSFRQPTSVVLLLRLSKRKSRRQLSSFGMPGK